MTQLTDLMPDLLRLARHLATPGQDPEDLAQEVLLKVWTRLDQGLAIDDLRPYLMTALRNQARRGPRATLELDEATLPTTEADAPRRLACAEVLTAVADLPESQAALLWRVVMDEPVLADLAQELDLPLGTLLSRLARARARLRRDLGVKAGAATDQLLDS
jgi:RNA polymerase sigma-70 factor (ECF subfamily)